MRAPAPRLAMIGLDAADLAFIRAAPERLPVLGGLLAGPPAHPLRSPAGLLPGAVWPTFFTAASPGEHGIYHHLQWDASAMRLRRVTPDWLPAEPFWYPLARRGRRVVALDVPMRSPSHVEHGIEVMNWGSHDQLGPFACHPPDLERAVHRRFGRHPMGCEIPVGKSAGELRHIRDALVAGAHRKGALARWLAGEAPWDLFVAVFGETHRGGHILWPDGPHAEHVPERALVDVYAAVDAAVGELLSAPAMAGAHVILFALHGMGPNRSQEHFVAPVMDRANARFAGAAEATARPAPAVVRWLRGHVPARLQNRVARMVPVGVRDAVVNRSIVAGHDWPHTPGFDVLADASGYLRLNLRGREREGALDPGGEEVARYVAHLRDCFASLHVRATGAPLVDAVHVAHERFPGARATYLPDLIVTWSGELPAAEVHSPVLGTVVAELATGRSGNHRPDGFCLLSGAAFAHLPPPGDIRDLAGLATTVLGERVG